MYSQTNISIQNLKALLSDNDTVELEIMVSENS